jgi:hypothetical protein
MSSKKNRNMDYGKKKRSKSQKMHLLNLGGSDVKKKEDKSTSVNNIIQQNLPSYNQRHIFTNLITPANINLLIPTNSNIKKPTNPYIINPTTSNIIKPTKPNIITPTKSNLLIPTNSNIKQTKPNIISPTNLNIICPQNSTVSNTIKYPIYNQNKSNNFKDKNQIDNSLDREIKKVNESLLINKNSIDDKSFSQRINRTGDNFFKKTLNEVVQKYYENIQIKKKILNIKIDGRKKENNIISGKSYEYETNKIVKITNNVKLKIIRQKNEVESIVESHGLSSKQYEKFYEGEGWVNKDIANEFIHNTINKMDNYRYLTSSEYAIGEIMDLELLLNLHIKNNFEEMILATYLINEYRNQLEKSIPLINDLLHEQYDKFKENITPNENKNFFLENNYLNCILDGLLGSDAVEFYEEKKVTIETFCINNLFNTFALKNKIPYSMILKEFENIKDIEKTYGNKKNLLLEKVEKLKIIVEFKEKEIKGEELIRIINNINKTNETKIKGVVFRINTKQIKDLKELCLQYGIELVSKKIKIKDKNNIEREKIILDKTKPISIFTSATLSNRFLSIFKNGIKKNGVLEFQNIQLFLSEYYNLLDNSNIYFNFRKAQKIF